MLGNVDPSCQNHLNSLDSRRHQRNRSMFLTSNKWSMAHSSRYESYKPHLKLSTGEGNHKQIDKIDRNDKTGQIGQIDHT